MDNDNSRSFDILGIKPVGESINTLVKGTVEGAAAFLGRICLPAAEEFGLLLRDKISRWRADNLVNVTGKAESILMANADSEMKHAHPRLLSMAVENSSWVDTEEVQKMWAGLLASSCTIDGKDESNLIFINLLSQLTTSQVKLLSYSCENSTKILTRAGWVIPEELDISLQELQDISGVQDRYRLDRELDHLRALELLAVSSGFEQDSTIATITPSQLGLHLYVRCQGSLQSPPVFFDLKPSEESDEPQQTLSAELQ